MTVRTAINSIERQPTTTSVDGYPATHDLATLDVIEVTGASHDTIMPIIENALEEGEAAIRMGSKTSYLLYQPLGVIDEPDGSKFDIVGYNDTAFEAVLVEAGPDEVATTGEVLRFERDDTTHYDVTLY